MHICSIDRESCAYRTMQNAYPSMQKAHRMMQNTKAESTFNAGALKVISHDAERMSNYAEDIMRMSILNAHCSIDRERISNYAKDIWNKERGTHRAYLLWLAFDHYCLVLALS